MTIMDQITIATDTKNTLEKFGLKQQYVAERCEISEAVFSKFLNGKAALNEKQLECVVTYIKDYVRRNS